jgi:hypothetical protein
MPVKTASPEKQKANARAWKWDQANTTRVSLKLNYRTDADMIAHFDALPNVQGYIKALIRSDMERGKPDDPGKVF